MSDESWFPRAIWAMSEAELRVFIEYSEKREHNYSRRGHPLKVGQNGQPGLSSLVEPTNNEASPYAEQTFAQE